MLPKQIINQKRSHMKKFFHRLTLCMLLGAWSLSSHADVVLNSTNFPDPVFRELLKSKFLRAEGETITNAQIADLKSFNTKDPLLIRENSKWPA